MEHIASKQGIPDTRAPVSSTDPHLPCVVGQEPQSPLGYVYIIIRGREGEREREREIIMHQPEREL